MPRFTLESERDAWTKKDAWFVVDAQSGEPVALLLIPHTQAGREVRQALADALGSVSALHGEDYEGIRVEAHQAGWH